MFRNKKQAVMILLSLFVALTAVISVNGIVKSNSAKYVLNHFHPYDIHLLNDTVDGHPEEDFNESVIKKLECLERISSIRKVIASTVQIPYDDVILGGYFNRLSKIPIIPDEYKGQLKLYKENNNKKDFTGKIVGIDEKGFDLINGKLGNTLNKEEFMAREIGIILGFLAVLNYGNMMETSIQSIGMTDKQIKKVVLYEGMGYGVILIGMSILIGGPISYLVFQAIDPYGLNLHTTILENIAVFSNIMLVCILVPLIVYKIVQKNSSIIEQMQESC